MTGWHIDNRIMCAVLTASCGILLALRINPRLERLLWILLLAAGINNTIKLNLVENNLVNTNLVQYYLGAKYSFPYSSFYKLINAAVGRPQVSMMDLDSPPEILRHDPREQRAYYIDLMRIEGVEFDSLAPLDQLQKRAEETGTIRSESQYILHKYLPADQVESFRSDTHLALLKGNAEQNMLKKGRDISWDYGFNGSPLYVLLRHIDPTIYKPFSRETAQLNLAWQILSVLLIAWITGRALELDTNGCLAIAVLIFSSWDFIGWTLGGLIFSGLWLPVSFALLAMRKRKYSPAGFAIAWAGLIKIFPFILLLPAIAQSARIFVNRLTGKNQIKASSWSFHILAWCALSSAVLASISMLSGHSWIDFLRKITVQFHSEGYLANSVSLSNALWTIGIYDSPLPRILSFAALAAIGAMFFSFCGKSEDFMDSLPRRSLLLLAVTGFFVQTWFSYYAMAPLFLLPLIAKKHRIGAAFSAAGMSMTFILPDFGNPLIYAGPEIHILKVAPYVIIPAWLIILECRQLEFTKKAKRIVSFVILTCILLTASEALRQWEIRRLYDKGEQYLDIGDYNSALQQYKKLVIFAPLNPMAQMNKSIALAKLNKNEEASAAFERAVSLLPENSVILRNYGHLLFSAGRLDEAAVKLEAAKNISPFDELILLELARVRLAQGKKTEAKVLLIRARELQPDNDAISALLLEAEH